MESDYLLEFVDESLLNEFVYIGPWKHKNPNFQKLKDETFQRIMKRYPNENEYLDFYEAKGGKGRVFYPERNNEKWSEEKNRNFIKTIIKVERPVLLIRDFYMYSNSIADFTGTSKEILWLDQNGYIFEEWKENKNFTVATKKKICKEIILKDYGSLGEGIKECKVRLQELYEEIKKQ